MKILNNKGFWIAVTAIIIVGFFIILYRSTRIEENTLPPVDTNNNDEQPIQAGLVDLWCNAGKYYKRTTTTTYGNPELLELTKQEYDSLVSKGITSTGCPV